MVKFDTSLEKIAFIPYPFYAIFSIIIGYLGDLIAFLLFPGFDLTFMISALGTGPGAIFFNIGTMISGIFALIFYIKFNQKLKNEIQESHRLFKLARITSINSCIFFILIGLFPGVPSNFILLNLHGFFALVSFLSALGYLLFYGLLFLQLEVYGKGYSYFAFFGAGIVTVFLFTWTPIIEWLMTFVVSVWIIALAVHQMR
jgi:hypothetical protein